MQQRKQKKILRINSLKLVHLYSRDDQIIQESLEQVLIFTNGLQLSYGLTSNDILQATHTAADEYYTFCHGMAWNTDSVIPAEVIATNSDLFRKCNNDLQGCVQANRLSKERIISIFNVAQIH